MSNEELIVAASRMILGMLPAEELVDVAMQAMEDGYDSPSLRILAGLTVGDFQEATTMFDRVLSELNVTIPNKRDAVSLLVQMVAHEIVAGSVAPYEGAKKIWDLSLSYPEEKLSEFDPFVYAASEWEDRPEDRHFFEDGIVVAAKELVENGSVNGSQEGVSPINYNSD